MEEEEKKAKRRRRKKHLLDSNEADYCLIEAGVPEHRRSDPVLPSGPDPGTAASGRRRQASEALNSPP